MATEPAIGLRSWPKGRDLIKNKLREALDSALETIGEEAAKDASEINGLRYRATRFDKIQAENETLRTDLANALEKLRKTSTSNAESEAPNRQSTTPKPIGERLPTLSPTREDGEAQKVDRAIYQHLVLKFNNLHQNHQEVIQARRLIEEKLRRAKELRVGWEHFSNGQRLYIRKLLSQLREAGLSPLSYPDDLKPPGATSRTSSDIESGARSRHSNRTGYSTGAPARTATPLPQRSDDFVSEDHDDQHEELFLPTLPADVAAGSSTKSDDPVLSSTQGDADEETLSRVQQEVIIKSESPDSPVILSCRSVKRKKVNDRSRNEEVKPKSEDLSSSIGLGTLYTLNESVDLDDVGQHIDTPKKKRQQLLDEILLAAPNQPMLKPVSFDSPGNSQNRSIRDSQNEHGRRGMSAPAVETTPQPVRRNTALQALSTNKKELSRTSESRVPKRRRIEDRVSGACLLAEDGENLEGSVISAPISTPKPAKRSKLDQSDLNQRLTGLLEHPSPQQNVLISGISPRTPRVTSPQKGKSRLNLESPTIAQRLHVSAGRELVGEGSPIARRTMDLEESCANLSKPSSRRSTRISGETVSSLADDPDNEPLRARPLSKLSLEHFKVNPDYNQGYEYAFSDVVRKRDERKCLPGCIDPSCCGDKFRKLAEMQLEARYTQPRKKVEEDEENRVMKAYLGTGYSRVRNMSKDERYQTLLEAMTWELSNKHGRHRHAYERRKSPPGFWRADFPTTQEEEQDREAARKVEREKVKERYMAAMRPDGPWLFRDE